MVTGAFKATDLGSIQGIRIAIPWKQLPHVNLYLIEDSPLTLVDAGANTPGAVGQVEGALAELGHRFEEIERVLITHQHADHIGLARELKARADAEIVVGDKLAGWLRDPIGRRDEEIRYQRGLLRRHGVDAELTERIIDHTLEHENWFEGFDADIVLADGQALDFEGRRITGWFRPGHSLYDMVFFDETHGVLFCGDHLLDAISSNPNITPEPGMPVSERPRMVELYLNSLRRTEKMEVKLALAGHGDPIERHRDLIGYRIERMMIRMERIRAATRDRRTTVFEIARQVWPKMPETESYLAMSEVLGYVDILADRGDLREIEAEGRVFIEGFSY